MVKGKSEEHIIMAKAATSASVYKLVMDSIASDTPVDKALFNEAVAYAKSSKRRAPKTDNFIDVLKPTKKTTVKKAVKKVVVKKAVAPKDATPKVCIEDDCDSPAYAKGRCSKHYTSNRRQDPEQKELANKASREYRARMAL